MKHHTITLVKFKALQSRLGKPLCEVVGILESLWLFTLHNARNGDLSKYTPADIAAWIEYPGDASSLVDVLVETRWLDRTNGGLVVHDWTEHQPNWLKALTSREQDGNSVATEKPLSQNSDRTEQVGLGRVRSKGTFSSKGKRAKKFTKPTADEVEAYCRERDNGITGEEFCDHYQANGWKCGKNQTPMRDWKATVRVWEAKRRKEKPAAATSKIVTPEEYSELVASGEIDAIVNGRAVR